MTQAKELEDLRIEVVAVRITPAIHSRISATAKKRYRSRSSIVTIATEECLDRSENPQ
jgi:predicted transcriptional regulator